MTTLRSKKARVRHAHPIANPILSKIVAAVVVISGQPLNLFGSVVGPKNLHRKFATTKISSDQISATHRIYAFAAASS